MMEDSLVAAITVFCYFFQTNQFSADESEISIDAEAQVTNSTIIEVQEDTSIPIVFNVVNLITSSVLGLILLALPIFIAIFYPINFKRMPDPDFEAKYGEVYGGMHPDRVECIIHPIFFLLRRYAFVITICIPMFSDKAWL